GWRREEGCRSEALGSCEEGRRDSGDQGGRGFGSERRLSEGSARVEITRTRTADTMSGIFITFEGGDGAGKTTQSELLASWLAARGLEVVRTREPGGTPLGVSVRELLLHGEHVDQRAEALLYAADRAQHIAEVVRPAIARGAVVVQDRYIDSS